MTVWYTPKGDVMTYEEGQALDKELQELAAVRCILRQAIIHGYEDIEPILLHLGLI